MAAHTVWSSDDAKCCSMVTAVVTRRRISRWPTAGAVAASKSTSASTDVDGEALTSATANGTNASAASETPAAAPITGEACLSCRPSSKLETPDPDDGTDDDDLGTGDDDELAGGDVPDGDGG